MEDKKGTQVDGQQTGRPRQMDRQTEIGELTTENRRGKTERLIDS